MFDKSIDHRIALMVAQFVFLFLTHAIFAEI